MVKKWIVLYNKYIIYDIILTSNSCDAFIGYGMSYIL